MTCACPHCGHDLPGFKRVPVYRKELRPYLLKPLFELCRAGRGLTLDQIAAESDDPTRVRRHFGELKLWHFIRKDSGKYYATELGKNFCNGTARAPDALYTVSNAVVSAPEGEPASQYLFIWETELTALFEPTRARQLYEPQPLPV